MADLTDATDQALLATSTAHSPTRGTGQPATLAVGDFLGRYKVIATLGAGGMGIVYRARDTDLNRDVAIKLLRPQSDGSQPHQVLQQRLLREAQAMAQLSHPNLVSVFDVGKSGDRVFVAMEFVDGMTLKDYLRDETRTFSQRLNAVLDAARGLIEAHSAGVVHRDFKPENVFVAKSGRVQVGDFGLARSMVSLEQTLPTDGAATAGPLGGSLTQTGAIVGTPAYMAPEQHDGKVADTRSDQFSLAVTLFEACYRCRPFAGDTMAVLRRAVQQGSVQAAPPASEVPKQLHTVLTRALRSDPDARFPTVKAFVAAVETATQPARPDRIGRGWLIGGVAVVVLALVVGAFALLRNPETEQTRAPAVVAGTADASVALNATGHDYISDSAVLVSEFLATERLAIDRCYQFVWRTRPLVSGTATLLLHIHSSGRVAKYDIVSQSDTFPKASLTCLTRYVRNHMFPAPKRRSATLKLALRMSPVASAGIVETSAGHFTVARGVLERLAREPRLISSGARLVASIRNGKPNGFKVYAIHPRSIYNALGLRNGDAVVAANNMVLTSVENMLTAYTLLKSTRQVELMIRRRGKQMTLRYDMVD